MDHEKVGNMYHQCLKVVDLECCIDIHCCKSHHTIRLLEMVPLFMHEIDPIRNRDNHWTCQPLTELVELGLMVH